MDANMKRDHTERDRLAYQFFYIPLLLPCWIIWILRRSKRSFNNAVYFQ